MRQHRSSWVAIAWSSQYGERSGVLPDGGTDGERLTARLADAPVGCPGIAPDTVPDKASPTAGRQMGES
ncbi:hypothetical protein BPORC_1858 [Bifidobacterium porcinum]|nr:hypothetical protein BPORC_1858 [Bifidobacterium porcinum]